MNKTAKPSGQPWPKAAAAKSDVKFARAWSGVNQALNLYRSSVVDRVRIVKDGMHGTMDPKIYLVAVSRRLAADGIIDWAKHLRI
jgi:hypothetical protein